MGCFERETYEPCFNKEAIDTVRWDKIDCDAIKRIFCQERLRLTAESMVNYFDNASGAVEIQKKMGRYLYPAGNFDDMLLFLQCAVKGEGYSETITHLTRNFAQDNGYDEPLWIIWGRFLTDVLDVLRQWPRYYDKAIDLIIENF